MGAADGPLPLEVTLGGHRNPGLASLRRRRSARTRWLTFANERGSVVMAPGVRTHQLSLLLGMGKDWYERAMASPESASDRPTWSEAVREESVRIVGENTVNLIGAPR